MENIRDVKTQNQKDLKYIYSVSEEIMSGMGKR
jgi:hypothetical protein